MQCSDLSKTHSRPVWNAVSRTSCDFFVYILGELIDQHVYYAVHSFNVNKHTDDMQQS